MHHDKIMIIQVAFEKINGNIHTISHPARQGATSQVSFTVSSKGNFVCKTSL